MVDETHECPAARCLVRVAAHQLMCRKHWKLVTPAMQREVYRTWKGGMGAGTIEHIKAMESAIAAVNKKLSER